MYHFKNQEIFISESALNEEQLANAYNELCGKLLLIKTISEQRIYEAINLGNYSIRSTPFITAALLRKKELPAFRFLICSN